MYLNYFKRKISYNVATYIKMSDSKSSYKPG